MRNQLFGAPRLMRAAAVVITTFGLVFAGGIVASGAAASTDSVEQVDAVEQTASTDASSTATDTDSAGADSADTDAVGTDAAATDSATAGSADATDSADGADASETDDAESFVAARVAPTTGSITGTVTRADTGDPVEDVWVYASGNSFGEISTAADGTYTLDELEPGDYIVWFMDYSDRNLVTEYWNDVYDWNSAQPITVAAGTPVANIDAELEVAGSISGVVTRADTATTISGVQMYFDGPASYQISTGLDGTYTSPAMVPGDYTVKAVPVSDTTLLPAFWENASSEDDATHVNIPGGTSVADIDFALVAGINISGTVTAEGDISAGAAVTAYRWSGSEWQETDRVTTWGDYAFVDTSISGGSHYLPGGEYTVGFTSPGYCDQYWSGKTTLNDATRFTPDPGTTQTGINAHLTVECDVPAVVPGSPLITGVPEVGQTLTANPGSWSPMPVELSYQWLANGDAIAGATASTFVATPAQLGAALTVKVTGTRPGHTTAIATSPATSPVAEAVAPPTVKPAVTNPAPGESIEISGTGFTPGETVRLELHSTPVVLGTVVADSDGNFRVKVKIPASTPSGAHTIYAIGQTSGKTVTAAVTVTGASPASPDSPSSPQARSANLAATGGEISPWMLTGSLVLLLAGGMLLRSHRRTAL